MSAPTQKDVGEPIRRVASDQQTDLDQTVKNFMDEKYREWPNDAGFDGLKEERGPIEIKVTGTIPIWTAGALYRTGPGQFQITDTAKGTHNISHWFDGLAHTHRFDIVAPEDPASGKVKVFYSSRRQSEALMRQIKEKGQQTMYSFGQRNDPCLGLFGKFMAAFHAATHNPGLKSAENICVTVQANPPGFEAASGNCIDGSAVPSDPQEDGNSQTPIQKNAEHRPAVPTSVWLASDTYSLREIDPMTMEPIGFATQAMLDPALNGPLSSAHSQRDPKTGDLYNFNLKFGKEAAYRVFRVNAKTGNTEILAVIQRADLNPAYIHSFFLSGSFVILCIPSSHLSWNGVKVAWERNVLDAIKPFDKNANCKWFVIDRVHGGGVVAEFETPAGFFFHTVNAFEEMDHLDEMNGTVSLFCDVVQYATTDVMRALYYDTITQKSGATQKYWGSEEHARDSNTVLVRHKVRVPYRDQARDSGNSKAANVTGTIVPLGIKGKDLSVLPVQTVIAIPGPHSGELPTINPRYATKRNRFCYGLPSRGLSTLVDTISKTNMDTGEAILWNNPVGHTPGEPIFVARPGGQVEDDGVLLSVVLDGNKGVSYLLCLDATTMKELGRAEVGFAIGLGFHGLHTQA